jgi:L-fucose mutarotase/ribose pyranase (RbsD/FucU family)
MNDTLRRMQPWEKMLIQRLALFGHRNWIVVADAAYPAHSRGGVETITADDVPIQVLQTVLNAVTSCQHIRPSVYIDLELSALDEGDAPGISEYRMQLDALLSGCTVDRLLHERTISKLDECAKMYRVLVIKTTMALPYTSIFLELECGYWDASAEKRLREAVMRLDSTQERSSVHAAADD